MADEKEGTAPARPNILIPMLSFAFAIFLQTVAGAFFIGRLTERVDNQGAILNELRTSIGQTVDQRVQNELMKSRLEAVEKQLLLLRDYTEGRISQMPYRRSVVVTGEKQTGGEP